MLKLNPNVEKELIQLLSTGKCQEYRDLARKIGTAYKAINDMFIANTFEIFLRLPPDTIIPATPCLDETKINIHLTATVNINEHEMDGKKLLEEINNTDELMQDEYNMKIENLSLDQAFSLLEKIATANTITWIPSIIKPHDPSIINEIFNPEADGYKLKLEQTQHTPKIMITDMNVWFTGKTEDYGIRIHLTSSMLRETRETHPNNFKTLKKKLEKTLAPYKNKIPITTTLELTPYY